MLRALWTPPLRGTLTPMPKTTAVEVRVADLKPVKMLVIELTNLRTYMASDAAEIVEATDRLERALTRFGLHIGELTHDD